MKTAIVFDSAGTLLRMYRVAKNMKTGEYIHQVVSTELVGKNPSYGILVMQVDSTKLVNCPKDMPVSDFIEKYNIDIKIGCSKYHIDDNISKKIIEMDTRTYMKDFQDVMCIINKKCKNIFYLGVGLIIDTKDMSVPYVLCTGGRMYPEAPYVMEKLREKNIATFIASGDSMRNLLPLAKALNIPIKRVFEISTPEKKEKIVKKLKEKYDKVFMVGDGLNDVLAFRAADVSVLTIQQKGEHHKKLAKEVDYVIKNLKELLDII